MRALCVLFFLLPGILLAQKPTAIVDRITLPEGEFAALTLLPDGRPLVGGEDGIYQYVGDAWRLVARLRGVSSLYADSSGRVYVGARGEFGLLVPNGLGGYSYTSFREKLRRTSIKEEPIEWIGRAGQRIAFAGAGQLLVLDEASGVISATNVPVTNPIVGLWLAGKEVLIIQRGIGVQQWADGVLKPIPGLPKGLQYVASNGVTAVFLNDEKQLQAYNVSGSQLRLDTTFTFGQNLPSAIRTAALGDSPWVVMHDQAGKLYRCQKGQKGCEQITGPILADAIRIRKTDAWVLAGERLVHIDLCPGFVDWGFATGVSGVWQLGGSVYAATPGGLYEHNEQSGFSLIDGLNETVVDMAGVGNDRFCITQTGFFRLKEDKAVRVVGVGGGTKLLIQPGEPDYIYLSRAGELVPIRHVEDGWQAEWPWPLPDLAEPIQRWLPLAGGELLVCNGRSFYRLLPPIGEQAPRLKEVAAPRDTRTSAELFSWQGIKRLVTDLGVYQYESDQLKPDTLLGRWFKPGEHYEVIGEELLVWTENRAIRLREESGSLMADTILAAAMPDAVLTSILSDSSSTWLGTSRGLFLRSGQYPAGGYKGLMPLPTVVHATLNDSLVQLSGVAIQLPGTGKLMLVLEPSAFLLRKAVQYRYRLAGEVWQPWQESGTLVLLTLPYGITVLEFQTRHPLLGESGVATTGLVVATPWYRLRWVWVLAGVVVVVGLWAGLKQMLLRQQKMRQRLRQEVMARTEELQAQNQQLQAVSQNATSLAFERLQQAQALAAREQELALANTQLAAQRAEVLVKNDDLALANLRLSESLSTIEAQQQKLLATERLSTAVRLAAGVAHELNSTIGAIKGSTQSLSVSFPGTLQSLEGVLAALPLSYQPLFFQLLAAHPAATPEAERQLREELIRFLTRLEMPQADDLALPLARLGVPETEILTLLPFLQSPIAVLALDVAVQLSRVQKSLGTIGQSVGRSERILTSLKVAVAAEVEAGAATVELPLVDIATTLNAATAAYEDHWKGGLKLVRAFQVVPQVQANAEELQHVWSNVLLNAIQAMGSRGEIRIFLSKPAANRVLVLMEDNGPGILPDHLQRIFDPFFTTKAKGEGTGLGLYSSKVIVEQHGGTITALSQPGRTIFRVELPAA